mmetsp:Transcript_47542/g.152345  ORF Transcript_47542/g.152345 Transcript_47542/m.152345 type:complete len:588 (-) Transcript_47542:122-1885(-)
MAGPEYENEFEVDPLYDADGCVENIYNFLWRKNSFGKTCPDIHLPDTVVYKYGQPAYWFFTSNKTKQLMRKNRANCHAGNIREAMLKKKSWSTSEVCASRLSGQDAERTERTTVEFLDDAGLAAFLEGSAKLSGGVLQKFVDPKGANNTVIRATWSPQVCLLERRVSKAPLDDRCEELHRRCVTFEGADHMSDSVPLSGQALASTVQRACNRIVEHVYESSGTEYRISRMVVNFKVDKEGRLWFLWCSSLRLGGDNPPPPLRKGAQLPASANPVNLDPTFVVRAPSKYVTSPARTPRSPAGAAAGKLLKSEWFKCPDCAKVVGVGVRCEVLYKTVVAHHDARVEAARRGRGRPAPGSVPRAIAGDQPELSGELYASLRSEPAFLYRTVGVCEACCLRMNDALMEGLELENPGMTSLPLSAPPGGVHGGAPPTLEAFSYDADVVFETGASRVGEARGPASPGGGVRRASAPVGNPAYRDVTPRYLLPAKPRPGVSPPRSRPSSAVRPISATSRLTRTTAAASAKHAGRPTSAASAGAWGPSEDEPYDPYLPAGRGAKDTANSPYLGGLVRPVSAARRRSSCTPPPPTR